jgi:predicted AAA+ superfamily ATPase
MNNMAWKEYLQERINAMPSLIKENTKAGTLVERPALYGVMRFARSFINNEGDSRMVILYGLRGIGKSTILYQAYDRLAKGSFEGSIKKPVPKENMLYLSLDQVMLQPEYSEGKSPLYEAVKNFCSEIHNTTIEDLNEKLFILVDEAQFDKKWAVASKTIFDSSKNIFLVITGSSALALNIDTDTARRAIKEPLFPLNFMEYQLMSNNIFPPRGTAESLKRLILQNDISMIPILNKTIAKIKEDIAAKRKSLSGSLEDYLTMGGFPYGLITSKEIAYRRILDMITRIVSQDVPTINNYEMDVIPQIMRVIGAVALKPSGELPQTKLSENLNIPLAKLNSILDTLQKTHLIFSVKPHPSPLDRRGVNKAFKFYFMSPTLLSALLYLNGKTTITNDIKSLLWENAVGSTLHKLCFTTGTLYNLFYDARYETNVDFILENPLADQNVPIEVGLNKDTAQIKNAIEMYKARYGVIVSDVQEISYTDRIITMPFWFFLYL